MSDAATYDAQVQAIRTYNQPFLVDFRAWLEQAGLSEKTARRHVSNIDLFSMYLVYDDPLKKLDEAHSGDVRMFLAYWAPRKVGWTSVTTVKIYLVSFKKFFQWMGETGCASPQTVAGVLTTLKEGREEFLARVAEF